MLLVELGATRERVSWLLAQNEQLKAEAAAAVGQAQAHAELTGRAQSHAANWRLVGIVAVGLYAIQAQAGLLPVS